MEQEVTTGNPPVENDYGQTVYDNLKENLGDQFTIDPVSFKKRMETDPAYAKNVHANLKNIFDEEFTLPETDFIDRFKKKVQTPVSPSYPTNLEESGNGSLENSPSLLPSGSPSDTATEPKGIDIYGFKWADDQPVGDARLGDVKRAEKAYNNAAVEQKKSKEDAIESQSNRIKQELKYSEKFGTFMDAETEEKEKSFFEQKGFSREAVDKSFAEEGEKRFKKNAYQYGGNLQEKDYEEASLNLKNQGFDEKKEGGQSDFIKAQADAVNTKIDQEAINSFSPEQLKVFNINAKIEDLYKKAKE